MRALRPRVALLAAIGAGLPACDASVDSEPDADLGVATSRLEGGFSILGHRGSRHEIDRYSYTENSLAAFNRARSEGAAGIEFDIVWTTDGKNLVFHDPDLSSRICRGSPSGRVETMTSAAVRLACTLLNGQRIMTLEEMYAQTKTWFSVYMLEIKDYGKSASEVERQTNAAIAAVRAAGMLSKTIFISYASRANQIIGEQKANGVIAGWDDGNSGNEQAAALAAPHQYYGTDWGYFADGTVDVNAFNRAGKGLFAYTVSAPQYYNRVFATGVRMVLTNDVATMALYRKWNPARGSNDVGVLSDTGCPSGREEVVIYTDDEDDNNQNRHNGWIGASTSESNTTLRFCRVDGRLLHPLARASSTASDFVVLKLGDNCPPGSVEFQRYLDNEDNGNENYALGDSRPYVSDRNTMLYFCQFKGNASLGFGSLPNLGFSYGVFAAPSFAYGSASGSFYTDDEDSGNVNTNNADSIGVQIVSSGTNTTYNAWRR